MSSFHFHTTVGPDGMIAVPALPELCGRDIDVRIVPTVTSNVWTDEDRKRREHLIRLLESAPVMTDEEYDEWREKRKWVNESVAAREKRRDDLD